MSAPLLLLPPAAHHWDGLLMGQRVRTMTDAELEATEDAHFSHAVLRYDCFHARSFAVLWREAHVRLNEEIARRWMRDRARRRGAAARAVDTRRWKKLNRRAVA